MSEFLFGLAELSLTMGAVIALLLALGPVLSRRFGSQWRCWAWLLVALRLAVPFNMALPAAPVVLEAPVLDHPAEEAVPYRPAPALSGEAASGVQIPVSVMSPEPAAAEPQYVPAPSEHPAPHTEPAADERSLPLFLTGLWAAGAAAVLAVQLWKYLRFARRVRRWQTAGGSYQGLAVYRCPAVTTPVLAGLLRPRILLPEDLEEEAGQFALLHEYTHYVRRDLWYKLLLLWVSALYWFHPLVWLMVRSAGRDLEIACDAQALREKDGDFRRRYGQALLSFAAGAGRTAPLTSGFADGMPGLRLRFKALVDTAPKRKGRLALAAVLCAALLGAGLVACRTAEEPAPSAEPAPSTAPASGVELYYGRNPSLQGNELTFTALQEDGDKSKSARLTFPLGEQVSLPEAYGENLGNQSVKRLLQELETLKESGGVYLDGSEYLMATVTDGTITALKWVTDPHLDGGDGRYYGVSPTLEDGVLTVTLVPYLPAYDSVSLLEEEGRQVSFPLRADVVLRGRDPEQAVSTAQQTFFSNPPDNTGAAIARAPVVLLRVQNGKVCSAEWRGCRVEAQPLADGVYYGLPEWARIPGTGAPDMLQLYLSAKYTDPAAGLFAMTLTALPVDPALQEHLLELLYAPMVTWEEPEHLVLQVELKNNVITGLSWVDAPAGQQWPGLSTSYRSVSTAALEHVDPEAGTISTSRDGELRQLGLGEYIPAPGVLVRLWDVEHEAWIDAGLEELGQKISRLGKPLSCELTLAGGRVVTIRDMCLEEVNFGSDVPQYSSFLSQYVRKDGIYYPGRRVEWGNITWNMPEHPIAGISTTLYELDPETGHVVDSSSETELIISRDVVCYNEDGTLWEGDLESFLEAFNQDAQALRKERRNYLTWPLNNILTLEATCERGMVTVLRRMPPPEL